MERSLAELHSITEVKQDVIDCASAGWRLVRTCQHMHAVVLQYLLWAVLTTSCTLLRVKLLVVIMHITPRSVTADLSVIGLVWCGVVWCGVKWVGLQ